MFSPNLNAYIGACKYQPKALTKRAEIKLKMEKAVEATQKVEVEEKSAKERDLPSTLTKDKAHMQRRDSLFQDFFAQITNKLQAETPRDEDVEEEEEEEEDTFRDVFPVLPKLGKSSTKSGSIKRESTLFYDDFKKLQDEYSDILPQIEEDADLNVSMMKIDTYEPAIYTERNSPGKRKR
ncbi:hypothetical protein MAR_022840 [Mya arenaria]|uniref:Uncharacterized protein n=1 Tax=Mya arenaria TaxID=6604 RepID=A0ABY7DLB1_MYAAR|nr:hypothetical protein MAR_022840 [Mya arenaria]